MSRKKIIMWIPYIILFYFVDKGAWLYRHCVGGTAVQRFGVMMVNYRLAFTNVLPSFHLYDLLVGITGALLIWAVVYFKGKNAKKFRQGEEYGSARISYSFVTDSENKVFNYSNDKFNLSRS